MRKLLRVGLIAGLGMLLSATIAVNGAPAGQGLAISFVQQIYRCWTPPIRADKSRAVVVRLNVHLNIDGGLAEAPTLVDQLDTGDPFVREAVTWATKAVTDCAPYRMPAAQYDEWKNVVIVFDPRSL